MRKKYTDWIRNFGFDYNGLLMKVDRESSNQEKLYKLKQVLKDNFAINIKEISGKTVCKMSG